MEKVNNIELLQVTNNRFIDSGIFKEYLKSIDIKTKAAYIIKDEFEKPTDDEINKLKDEIGSMISSLKDVLKECNKRFFKRHEYENKSMKIESDLKIINLKSKVVTIKQLEQTIKNNLVSLVGDDKKYFFKTHQCYRKFYVSTCYDDYDLSSDDCWLNEDDIKHMINGATEVFYVYFSFYKNDAGIYDYQYPMMFKSYEDAYKFIDANFTIKKLKV